MLKLLAWSSCGLGLGLEGWGLGLCLGTCDLVNIPASGSLKNVQSQQVTQDHTHECYWQRRRQDYNCSGQSSIAPAS